MAQHLPSPLRACISQRKLQTAGIRLTEDDFSDLNEKTYNSPAVEPFRTSKHFCILFCYVNINNSQDMSIGF